MRKLLFFLALTVIHIGAKTIVGSPTVEINSQGVYLVEIKISGDETLVEDDILITNDGPVNLSAYAPRTAEGIESMMQQPSVLDAFVLPELDSLGQ